MASVWSLRSSQKKQQCFEQPLSHTDYPQTTQPVTRRLFRDCAAPVTQTIHTSSSLSHTTTHRPCSPPSHTDYPQTAQHVTQDYPENAQPQSHRLSTHRAACHTQTIHRPCSPRHTQTVHRLRSPCHTDYPQTVQPLSHRLSTDYAAPVTHRLPTDRAAHVTHTDYPQTAISQFTHMGPCNNCAASDSSIQKSLWKQSMVTWTG
jgi:hypothetical protein